MLMTTLGKYTIKNKTIRFLTNFNEPMDLYYVFMRNMNVLMFNGTFYSYTNSKFNQPIILTSKLHTVVFGLCFNNLIILNSRVRILIFDFGFNQPIVLSSNIKILTFGTSFNQRIVLTPNIERLIFGEYFNKPIFLTKKIKRLRFGMYFNQPIILTREITHLILNKFFVQPIVLTKHMVCLSINCNNYSVIDDLPNSVKRIIFGYNFRLRLDNVVNDAEIFCYHKF